MTAYYRDILAHIAVVPGVTHAAVMTGNPLYGGGFGMPFTLEGGPTYADPSQRPGTGFGMVTPDYFKPSASSCFPDALSPIRTPQPPLK